MPPLRLIGDDELDLTPDPPEFESLAAQHLAALPNAETSLDDLLTDIGAGLDAESAFVASLDSDTDDAAREMPELEPGEEADVQNELVGSVEGLDGVVRDFENDLGIEPPPGDGGGGGGGGGGGIGVGQGGGVGGGDRVVDVPITL